MSMKVIENEPKRMYCFKCESKLFPAGGIVGHGIDYWSCPEHGVQVILKPAVIPSARNAGRVRRWLRKFIWGSELRCS